MEIFESWTERFEGWLQQDYELLSNPAGWRSVVDKGDVQVWSRALPDDANRLFRWRLPMLEANAEIVFEGFVERILDYHRHWTREFAGGHVVATLPHQARVLYQRFEPGVPGIAPRDLCSIEVVRELSAGQKLASFRSIDRVPAKQGHERIDWWGAALCTTRDDGKSSELIYLDRENQGGRFPTWLMNRLMPHYLVTQAREVRRFFAGGGPEELRIRSHA